MRNYYWKLKILTTAVGTEKTVAAAAIELEQRVLQHFAAVESDGEIGNLDVPALGVDGERACARPRLRVRLRVRLQLGVQRLCEFIFSKEPKWT
jgi:lysozyme family protein